MRLALVVTLGALVGCSKNDKCQQFVDKSTAVLKQIGGGKVTSAKLDEMVEMCRSRPANKDQELMDCVLAANDQPAVATCWESGMKAYAGASKGAAERARDDEPKTEADAELDRLGELAKAYYATHESFPDGRQPLGVNCCHQAAHECIADPSRWEGIWKELGFTIDHKYHAQYSYDGGKASFIAKALVDSDCDGQTVEVMLHGMADDAGKVTLERSASGMD